MKSTIRVFKALPAAILLIALSFVGDAAAQTWTQLAPGGGFPVARMLSTAVYNQTNNRMIVFGGYTGDPDLDPCGPSCANDVWVLTNADGTGPSAWTPLSPTGTPPSPRGHHSAVYDAATNRLIVYGGDPSIGFCSGAVNDVWVLTNADGTGGAPSWTKLNPTGTAPDLRQGPKAVYDSVTNRMVVFGGRVNSCDVLSNNVWVLTNANGLTGTPAWTQLSPIGDLPAARQGHAAVYDAASNRMVVFGGTTNAGATNDVWVLESANGLGVPAWTQLSPTGAPPVARSASSAVYDRASNRMVVFAGETAGGLANDVWELTNSNGLAGTPVWTQRIPTGGPPAARGNHTAVLNTTNNRMTVYAGYNSVLGDNFVVGDAWVLAGALSPPPVSVTVTTSPVGLSITVDSVAYTAPQGFSWVPGSPHSIGTTSPQTSTGTRHGFTSWSDAGAISHGVTGPATPTTYTASFATQYLLTTTAAPVGGGTIVASPSSGDGYYTSGTPVQLTATANAGYGFCGWTGDLTGVTNPQTVTLNAPRDVTASFCLVAVTVTTNPVGRSFTVDSVAYTAPQAFSWVSGSSHTIATGSPQTVPGTRYVFTSWSDAGAISHAVTGPASPATYTASFATQYLLTTTAAPVGGGTIVASPSSVDGYYATGTPVQLTASANAGSEFCGWTGDLTGMTNPQIVTLSAPRTVTANFCPPSPTIAGISSKVTAINTPITVNITVGGGANGPAGLAVSGSSSNQTLVPNANLALSGAGASRTLTITPVTGRRGVTLITLAASDGTRTVTTPFSLIVGSPVRTGDFDADGIVELAVFRPSTGVWYIRGLSTTTWGGGGDIPVAADYDGDGKSDVAVYRPSTGAWFILRSSTAAGSVTTWGGGADIPAPGDYDGDGKADIAVFRPSTGVWFALLSSTSTGLVTTWGGGADIPVARDYDGDGKTDVAVFRPSTGAWFILQSSTATGSVATWGGGGDIPVSADYDGDGKADVAAFRPSTGTWFILNSSTATGSVTTWGGGGDIPVPGEYDGDLKADLAVFRPSTGAWFIINSSTGSGSVVIWGGAGDIPVLKRP